MQSAPSLSERILDAAVQLLETEGVEGVSTRAVTARAGVQAPALYRTFGDKDGLLAAAAERIQAEWVRTKSRGPSSADPVEVLRAGWNDAVQFGLDHPAAYRVSQTRSEPGPAYLAGYAILTEKMRRVAEAGRLLETPERAAMLFNAAGRGVIATLLDHPVEQRDLRLSELARESILRTIAVIEPETAQSTVASAAGALRSLLPAATALAPEERQLLDLWLHRLSE